MRGPRRIFEFIHTIKSIPLNTGWFGSTYQVNGSTIGHAHHCGDTQRVQRRLDTFEFSVVSNLPERRTGDKGLINFADQPVHDVEVFKERSMLPCPTAADAVPRWP